jgi:hypothetical protein
MSSELTRATFDLNVSTMLSAIQAGHHMRARLLARRVHAQAIAMDQSLSDSWNAEGILCPTCGGNDWGAEFRGVVSGPAIPMIDPVFRLQAKETLNPLTIEPGTARLNAFFCNGCNFYAPADKEYARCYKDGRLVVMGDTCAACGVHYSEVCEDCKRPGYHAEDCVQVMD